MYENNKSAATAIKDEIKKRLGVCDNNLQQLNGAERYIEINSALVSAQNRQRFYVHNCGDVQQPGDRGILLKDILEEIEDGAYKFEAIPVNDTKGKSGTIRASCYKDGMRNLVGNTIDRRTCVAYSVNSPIKVGSVGKGGQGNRIYSVAGKAVAQTATSGGLGSNTGLYAIPVENVGEAETVQKSLPKLVKKYGYIPEMFNAYNVAELKEKSPTLSTGSMATSSCATLLFVKVDGKDYPVYEVKDGMICIKEKYYPIKLEDGYYIIRKLTVKECCRLQTLPDDYCRAVSNAQAYKGLGNGWTADVIIHILQSALKDVPHNEEIVVLSMYDGIGTGRYCLDKMGFTNIKYYAYEIDKYAMQIAMSNYPDIIQCGDAFQVRLPEWQLPNFNKENT